MVFVRELLKISIFGKYELNYSNLRFLHIYKNINPWNNNNELAQYLSKNILYYENGLLVLNKPYGVTFSRDGVFKPAEPVMEKNKIYHHDIKKTVIEKTIASSGMLNDDLSLVGALSHLKKELGLTKLHIVRVPERYTSGVAILATDKTVVENVEKCVLRTRPGKEPMETYQAIVVGCPRYENSVIKLGLKLDVSKSNKDNKKPILLRGWSHNSVKRHEVIESVFSYKTIQQSNDSMTSLVEVSSTRKRWHCVRLFCSTYLLSPVLGDNLYAGRVKNVMGVSVPVSHWSPVGEQPQKLSREVLNLLDIPPGESGIVPIHLHLSNVVLKNFKLKEDLVLSAPVPDHFSWSCQKLNLDKNHAELKYMALS